ncbi:MAG: glycosyltransferase, partial [Pirellulales bacterium]|nr:glycosyltransferase [Pirellulales bacterium]
PSLVQSRPSVAQTFNLGEEIFTFDKLEELVDLVPLLVSDDKEISAVGNAAWSKRTAEHTWAQRWRSFLDPWLQEERLDSRSDFPLTNHSEQLIRAS